MLSFGNLKGPSIVFLHGFLGDHTDCLETASYLKNECYCHFIDLPGHGASSYHSDPLKILETLQALTPFPQFFVGYSLGGRILLNLKEKMPSFFNHLIILSSHIGLKNEQEKKEREAIDQRWHEMLKTKPLETFLDAWYAQSLFDSLREKKLLFEKMLERRKQLNPVHLAKCIRDYSLSRELPYQIFPKTDFIYGKEDLKFAALYRTLPSFVKVHAIENAGHALLLEAPKQLASIIKGIIYDQNR